MNTLTEAVRTETELEKSIEAAQHRLAESRKATNAVRSELERLARTQREVAGHLAAAESMLAGTVGRLSEIDTEFRTRFSSGWVVDVQPEFARLNFMAPRLSKLIPDLKNELEAAELELSAFRALHGV